MLLMEIAGSAFIILGMFFNVVGVLGILRLPDTYTRLHASGKTSTLGVIFLCVGTAFIRPSAFLELVMLSIFLIFSAPVASHAIAAAVHRGTAIRNKAAENEGQPRTLVSGVHHIPPELLQHSTYEND